ncbi:MAG TPA: C39 family peptidase [Sphingomonas sp.]|nr:C39 family peptidase [Sphingomonas sp.]
MGGTGDLLMPVRSMEEQKFAGIVRQRYDFSCGSAALATLLRFHYGRAMGEQEAFLGMWRDGDRDAIRKVGFSLLDMKRYLSGIGLAADGFKVSLDQIQKTAIPGIALITVKNYRHFVVVKGVSDREVLIGDSSVGLRAVPRDEFQALWNGVYFVLNAEKDRGRKAFNTGLQWASLPRAPLGARFTDPISQQALALTAPFYRDF